MSIAFPLQTRVAFTWLLGPVPCLVGSPHAVLTYRRPVVPAFAVPIIQDVALSRRCIRANLALHAKPEAAKFRVPEEDIPGGIRLGGVHRPFSDLRMVEKLSLATLGVSGVV